MNTRSNSTKRCWNLSSLGSHESGSRILTKIIPQTRPSLREGRIMDTILPVRVLQRSRYINTAPTTTGHLLESKEHQEIAFPGARMFCGGHGQLHLALFRQRELRHREGRYRSRSPTGITRSRERKSKYQASFDTGNMRGMGSVTVDLSMPYRYTQTGSHK